MPDKPDDEARRRIKNAYKQAERAKARAGMILDRVQLESLLDFLDVEMGRSGCDNTPRHALAWAAANQLDPSALKKSLDHFGGFCDCEILANVEPDQIFERAQ